MQALRARTIVVIGFVSAWAGAPALYAQGYPGKPVRIVVPYAPGGISDRLARLVGQNLSVAWSQPVVVENRPGGGTNIGSEAVAKSGADGYTILWAGIANTVMPALHPKLPYDPLKDFAWVTNLAKVPVLIVCHPSLPARNARELIALAKAKPGALSFGSAGIATSGHLAGELFKLDAKLDLVHIPYKGASQALVDTLSGQIPLYFGAMASPISHVKSGRLRAIALTTLKRSVAAPEIPTLHEQGVTGFETSTWYGVAVPAATPAPIVQKLQADIARAAELPNVRERLASEGAEFVTDTPEAFTVFVKNELAKWARVVRDAGIKAD
ncbi:MAG: tripartite tricarboxylate transporter substrate binding protein [Burkholderiales bacterium]|nr:tripartite tricarboxylate transporter substrate binding protein [Burkholderiales bacterium]